MSPRFPYCHHQHADPDSSAPALTVRFVSVGYPNSTSGGRLALENVSLSAPVGSRIALVGPNGAGKSTLIKAIAGLLPIVAGDIKIHGHSLGTCHDRVAYLPQRGEIDWRFPIDVRRLVLTGRYVHLGWLRWPSTHDWAKVDSTIERLGLSDLSLRQIGQLSGGQQQRVLLARALAQDASLLLLDEPLNAVDAETRAVIADVLRDLRTQGKTVVAATHDLGRLEADFDGAIYLMEGREVPPPPGAFIGLSVGRFEGVEAS